MAIVTWSYLTISNYGGPAKELQHITEFEDTAENAGADLIAGINRSRRPIGHQKGVIKTTGSFTTKFGVNQEIDWHDLMDRMVEFVLTGEEAESGRKRVYEQVMITNISRPRSAEGNYEASVDWQCLNARRG